MSIHVFYQPIDIGVIHDGVFPFIRGDRNIDDLLQRCDDPEAAIDILQPLRNAFAAHLSGSDYSDPEWGRCDPSEFLADRLVRAVLEFGRHVWPYRLVNAITTIDLLSDDFPVRDNFLMPIALFQRVVSDLPEIAPDLETIADSENMGGIVPKERVHVVLASIVDGLARTTRDPNDPAWYDAMLELQAALTYANDNALSFTEAIE